jgi:hypothetical protein
MVSRKLPVRPNLNQLKNQARELLRAIRKQDPVALAELTQHYPRVVDPTHATLANAQHVLARSYEVSSWPRLVQACRLIDFPG